MMPASTDRVRNIKQTEKQKELLERLIRLRNRVDHDGRARFETWRPWIRRRQFLCSGINLAHYLALREHDLRDLQLELSPLGLSSLGRLESKVIPALDSVIASLARICDFHDQAFYSHPPCRAMLRGERILEKRSEAVLGTASNMSQTRIMVTLPAESASDADMVVNLLRKGMDVPVLTVRMIMKLSGCRWLKIYVTHHARPVVPAE
jgi:pyruvate kinase